jgi:hypothetical protein
MQCNQLDEASTADYGWHKHSRISRGLGSTGAGHTSSWGLRWRRRARTEAEENVFDGLFVRSTGGESILW